MVLIIVGVIFIVGLGAVTAVIRDTQSGKNFAAYAVALEAAQSGAAVARRRLGHLWDVNMSPGQNWPGNGAYEALPAPDDGRGALMDAYYLITVQSTATTHTVTSTGRAVIPGGNVNNSAHVLATRSVRAVFQRPNITVPQLILSQGNVYVPNRLEVRGDVHSNGNITVAAGGKIKGQASAVGTISGSGTIEGGSFPNAKAIAIPPILYYIYRPTYAYNGGSYTAAQISGSVLGSTPPMGLPGNPNNVFYNESSFWIAGGVNINGGTVIGKYDVMITGTVTIKGSSGFPAMIINGDLLLEKNSTLNTEGMVYVRGRVRQVLSSGVEDTTDSPPRAKWSHKGPVVFEGSGFSTNCHSDVILDYKLERVNIQPLTNMVLPVNILSYTENL
jgi:cytoskeletal protein CcmA (bactofilin family)